MAFHTSDRGTASKIEPSAGGPHSVIRPWTSPRSGRIIACWPVPVILDLHSAAGPPAFGRTQSSAQRSGCPRQSSSHAVHHLSVQGLFPPSQNPQTSIAREDCYLL